MSSLAGYQEFLKRKRLVPEKQAPFYLRWVSSYLSFCDEEDFAPADDSHILPFLQHLAKTKEDWQVNQAREALRLYLYFLSQTEKQGHAIKYNQFFLIIISLLC